MPTITTTIEDTSPLIIYSGSGGSDWAAGTSANDTSLDKYSQASYMVTSNLGADLSFAFYGSGVQLYGATRQNHGYYQITIDSKVYPQVDGTVNPTFQASLFSSVALKNGYHTVRMTNMGAAPLDIDFITWQTPVGSTDEALLTSIAQDSDDAFKYSSDSVWSTNSSNFGMFLGGSGHVTTTAGAFVEYCFKVSTVIGIYGAVGPIGAPYSVQLDGGTPTNYSSTKASYRPQTMLYYASNLGSKEHTVRLTHTAWNNSALTLAIDYAEVFTTPSLTGGSTPLSLGAIVGIAVGGVLGLLALVVGVVILLKRWGVGPSNYLRLPGRIENRASIIVEPFEQPSEGYFESLDTHTALQSQPYSTLQSQTSHTQLRSQSSYHQLPSQSSGHLRSQISHSTIQQTPPTTGLWLSPSGNYEPSPATSPGHDATRFSSNVQVITVPFTADGKYRPDLVAPQLHPVPSTTSRRNPLPNRPLRPNRGQPLPPGAEPPVLALTRQEAAVFFEDSEGANNRPVNRKGAPPDYVS